MVAVEVEGIGAGKGEDPQVSEQGGAGATVAGWGVEGGFREGGEGVENEAR